MNKTLWYLINLWWNLIKYIQFDGFINDGGGGGGGEKNNKNTATNQNDSSNEPANERLSNSGQPIKTTMSS